MPVAWRLYLPKSWATDDALRRKARIPAEVGFATKSEIALAQIRDAVARDLPRGVLLADAAYGSDMGFRLGVIGLGLSYAVGVMVSTTVWGPGTGPLGPAPSRAGVGRPSTRLRVNGGAKRGQAAA